MENINIQKVRTFLSNCNLEFSSIQSKLSYPIIERIFYRLKAGKIFGLIKVDQDKKLIVDGHHRYVSLCLLNSQPIENIPWISNFSSVAYAWSDVEISEDDFDNLKEIAAYEAKYGEINIPPNEIV